MLKAFRLRMIRKQDGKGICVYYAAETEAEARRFFEESFSRFYDLERIADASRTKSGKAVLSAAYGK